MVLVYEEEDLGVMTEAEATRRDQRKIFQVFFTFLYFFGIPSKSLCGFSGKSDQRWFRIRIGT